jgi:MFS family permease
MPPDTSEHAASIRLLAPTIYIPALLVSVALGMATPVLPLFAARFTAAYSLIGLVVAGAGLGALAGDLPSGLLVAHLGSRRMMIAGLLAMAASLLAMTAAGSLAEMVIDQVICGLGTAIFSLGRHTYIAEAVPVAVRGRVVALFGGTFRVGSFIGPALGGFVGSMLGLRAAFPVMAVLVLGALALVLAFLPVTPHGRQAAAGNGYQEALLGVRSQARVLAAAGTGQVFAQMVRAGRRALVPLYAANVLGLGVQPIGLIESLASAVDMAMFFPAGLLMDRLGRKYAIVPSFIIQAVGMALVPLAGSLAGLLGAACLIGFGNGISAGTMMTLGADFAPRQGRGAFLGVWRFIGDIGYAGGPSVVGGVADVLTLPSAALAMAGAGLAAGLIFALLVPETLNRKDLASGS